MTDEQSKEEQRAANKVDLGSGPRPLSPAERERQRLEREQAELEKQSRLLELKRQVEKTRAYNAKLERQLQHPAEQPKPGYKEYLAVALAQRNRQLTAKETSLASTDRPQIEEQSAEETRREDQQIKTTATHYGVKNKLRSQRVAAELMGTSDRTYRKYRDNKWLLNEEDFKRITEKTIAEYWKETGGS